MLVNEVVDIVTVSGALGHSNSTTTLNVYCHQFQNAQARVAEAMDGALGFLDGRKPEAYGVYRGEFGNSTGCPLLHDIASCFWGNGAVVQSADKPKFWQKEKLSKGFIKPFERSFSGDPYGN